MKFKTLIFRNLFTLIAMMGFLIGCLTAGIDYLFRTLFQLTLPGYVLSIPISLFISTCFGYRLSKNLERSFLKSTEPIQINQTGCYPGEDLKLEWEWETLSKNLAEFSNQQSFNPSIYDALENKVKERTRDLEAEKAMVEFSRIESETARRKAEDTLVQLRASQNQLIINEKMIALGQLVDGVAHELNTPLGAIKACAESIKNSTQNSATFLFELIRYLKNNEVNLMQSLLILNFNNQLSSREEREFKRSMARDLESRNISFAYDIAETLVPLGITEVGPLYDPLWKHEKFKDILHFLDLEIGLEKRASIIEKAVDKTSKIVTALKSFSNTSPEGKRRVSLVDGLETTITVYGNFFRKGILLNRHYEDSPNIECYPDRLIHVWTHLLSNCIQAVSDQSGEISITVKIEAKSETEDIVKIHFQDNGKGIPEDIHEKIFEPFFTTKKSGEGTGLGLHICKQIISEHGGKIHLQSQPGKTVFTVELPV